MKITEAIQARRSVRTYNGEGLDDATATDIARFIGTLTPPFGADCRVELVRTAASAESMKLGTYGAVAGATDWLALITRGDGPRTREGAAYLFEQTLLHCTALGLGTCWIVGFFDRGGFRRGLALGAGERLVAVSPVGRAAAKPHLSLSTLFNGVKPTPRKPFGENFFDGAFGVPLTEAAADIYALPLEMVRRAPSAYNRQSWRVVFAAADADGGTGAWAGAADAADAGANANVATGVNADTNTASNVGSNANAGTGSGSGSGSGTLHLYKTPSKGYEDLDAGIALCHFAETCREHGIAGRLEVLSEHPVAPKATYVASWVA